MAMNGKMKKGCAIGCGVVTLVLFVIIGSVAFFVRDMSTDYKAVKKSEEALLAAHGGLLEYNPPSGGIPSAERLQVFLRVRRDQAEWRQNVALAFDEFLVQKEASDTGGFKHFLGLLRSTTQMAPSLASFWSSRNAALMEHEMGPGEYSYIYCLAYFSYLSYDPGDGAQDSELDFGKNSRAGIQVDTHGEMTETERRDAAWRHVHDLMLPMLQAVDRTNSSDDWLRELDLEIAVMDESPLHYPWRNGAPRLLSDAFRPFRRELEQQYNVAVNPVELIFEFSTSEE